MPSKTRPTRSWLFTPGTRPDRFAKAAETGADVLIIDLEDAVSPGDKPKARATAIEYLSSASPDATSRALRINGLDTQAGIADLDALLTSDAVPDFLVLPKTESPGTCTSWTACLPRQGGRRGWSG
jgi:(S)-citramalyl-CoA lyase